MWCWNSSSHLCCLPWGWPAFDWQNSAFIDTACSLHKSGSCFIITSECFYHAITWTYYWILTVSSPEGERFPSFFPPFSTNSCWFMSFCLNIWCMLVACCLGWKRGVVPAKSILCNSNSMLAVPVCMTMIHPVVGKHLCRSRELGMHKIEKKWEHYIIDSFYHGCMDPLKQGNIKCRSGDLDRLKIELIPEMCTWGVSSVKAVRKLVPAVFYVHLVKHSTSQHHYVRVFF